MPTFADIVADVVAETKRADRMALIKSRINAAIKRISSYHTYKFDLAYVEYSIPVADQGEYIHLIPWASIPLYRKANAVQGASDAKPLALIQAKDATCGGIARKGTYYESAAGIHVALYNTTTMIKIAYWSSPATLVATTDTSWHLDVAYQVVLDLANAYVYRAIGDTAEYDRLLGIAEIQLRELKNDIAGL